MCRIRWMISNCLLGGGLILRGKHNRAIAHRDPFARPLQDEALLGLFFTCDVTLIGCDHVTPSSSLRANINCPVCLPVSVPARNQPTFTVRARTLSESVT